jgi:hypothetical protein
MHSVARLDTAIASGIELETVIARSEAALTVIASEAKQSISPRKERMDCFVASLLAMTALQFSVIASRSRRTFRARFAKNVPPSEIQRAQGMPGARCTRSLACE